MLDALARTRRRPGALLAARPGLPHRHRATRTGSDDGDFRSAQPAVHRRGGAANQAIADAVAQVAEQRGVTAAQVALAWVHGQGARLGVSLAPIPGTKRVKWLEQNVAAVAIELTADDLAVLDALADRVVGARY